MSLFCFGYSLGKPWELAQYLGRLLRRQPGSQPAYLPQDCITLIFADYPPQANAHSFPRPTTQGKGHFTWECNSINQYNSSSTLNATFNSIHHWALPYLLEERQTTQCMFNTLLKACKPTLQQTNPKKSNQSCMQSTTA